MHFNVVWAKSNFGTIENQNCASDGKLVVPKQFIKELLEEIYNAPFYQDSMPPGGDTKIHSQLYYLRQLPYFEERLRGWRISHGLPITVDRLTPSTGIPLSPISSTVTAQAAIGGLTTIPQHSIADNIFRKKNITLLLYDSRYVDGDVVNVFLNEVFLKQVLLPDAFHPYRLPITLQPSDLLRAKTNILKFVGVRNGNIFDPAITIGVAGVRDIATPDSPLFVPGEIFEGSTIAGESVLGIPGGGHANTTVGGQVTMNLALGLACVDSLVYPESAKHVREAQALGYSRIVTKDSASQSIVDARRRSSTATCRLTPIPNYQCDEYPHAMFFENAGRAHVKKIPSTDNQGSGSKVGSYAQAHWQGGQLEVIVPNGNLNCVNAF